LEEVEDALVKRTGHILLVGPGGFAMHETLKFFQISG
jgi:hypothetical protein